MARIADVLHVSPDVRARLVLDARKLSQARERFVEAHLRHNFVFLFAGRLIGMNGVSRDVLRGQMSALLSHMDMPNVQLLIVPPGDDTDSLGNLARSLYTTIHSWLSIRR